jgi:quercetin 2,3-dioxygenase
VTIPRQVATVIPGQLAEDGAGVKIRRVFPVQGLSLVDPFLLFDEFGSDDPDAYIAGFPDHPHRGFETVTYMLAGRMRHRDSRGNSGLLIAGSAQWMTAGRGIVHSEMPEQTDGLMRGFQIWVNLPAAEKMSPPRYQDFAPDSIPIARLGNGAVIRVVAGSLSGMTGPVAGISRNPLLADIDLPAGLDFETPLDAEHTVLVHIFEGKARIAGREIAKGHMAVLGPGDTLHITAGPDGARFLILAAKPIGEPVARAGPFVMNTREEIYQAYQDYSAGRLA